MIANVQSVKLRSRMNKAIVQREIFVNTSIHSSHGMGFIPMVTLMLSSASACWCYNDPHDQAIALVRSRFKRPIRPGFDLLQRNSAGGNFRAYESRLRPYCTMVVSDEEGEYGRSKPTSPRSLLRVPERVSGSVGLRCRSCCHSISSKLGCDECPPAAEEKIRYSKAAHSQKRSNIGHAVITCEVPGL